MLPTPQPLYNMARYNTVLDITQISAGPQMVIKDLFSYITIHFTLIITRFGKVNTEIGLDPNNSVIKRLWCTKFRRNRPAGSGEEDF